MGPLTCLTDPTNLVVADTSVVINLNASGFAQKIVETLPNRIVIVEAVFMELEKDNRRDRADRELLRNLIVAGLIKIVQLGSIAEQEFEKLVIGRTIETLDDGEAATIAFAVEHHGIALIDERKANRICSERFPNLLVGSTVDLFAHPEVQQKLGRNKLAMAIVNSLKNARMRVLPHYLDWIIGVIGMDQAAQCESLPKSARCLEGNVIHER